MISAFALSSMDITESACEVANFLDENKRALVSTNSIAFNLAACNPDAAK
jgi:hypothetical protein